MITKHFFGLIECYECQGVCYYKDFAFNSTFLSILYPTIFLILISLSSLGLYFYIKYKKLKEKN